jgi:hypothetical protein
MHGWKIIVGQKINWAKMPKKMYIEKSDSSPKQNQAV